MDIIYNQIADRLEANIPALRWIDFDTAQFEAFEDNYPINFPAVLIGFPNTEWRNVGRQLQTGNMRITFRLGFKITEDTHASAPDRAAATLKLRLMNDLHKYLQGFSGNHFNRLDRISTTSEILGGEKPLILVYTFTYTTNIRDAHGIPEYSEQSNTPLNLTTS